MMTVKTRIAFASKAAKSTVSDVMSIARMRRRKAGTGLILGLILVFTIRFIVSFFGASDVR